MHYARLSFFNYMKCIFLCMEVKLCYTKWRNNCQQTVRIHQGDFLTERNNI